MMDSFWRTIQHLTVRDAVDIFVVALMVYGILRLIKNTRAMQMVYGLMALGVLYFLSSRMHLRALEFVLRNALLYIGIAVIVIFQTEIRAGLVQFGRYLPRPFGTREPRLSEYERMFEEVLLAVTTLAAQKMGALIVFERTIGLQNFIETGVRLEAPVSYDLLVSIFHPRVPLHDGAVIIRGNRIVAASCFLPLTLNPHLSKEFGTRHRAAIGVTEDTDAVVIVVSEETGIISFVAQGRLYRHMDTARLRQLLRQSLEPGGGRASFAPAS
ncbi:MAG TPA: diadenylate cyclase CdaA [Blastocatellia bacterium]|nr:diadenylate cyclase CdaA [Blastocatellia bacterium]